MTESVEELPGGLLVKAEQRGLRTAEVSRHFSVGC